MVTTKEYNIPHSRPRVYIVAVRKDSLKHEFVWPDPEKNTKTMGDFLDESNEDRKYKVHLSAAARKRLKAALKHITDKGGVAKDFWFVDVDASDDYLSWVQDVCPCVTKSRGANGFYITKFKGMMALEEVMRFQGYDPERLRWKDSGVCRTSWGHAMGDSMSLNVLSLVLKHACRAAGLI